MQFRPTMALGAAIALTFGAACSGSQPTATATSTPTAAAAQASPTSSATPGGNGIATIAAQLGIPAPQLQTTLEQEADARVDKAVSASTISADQAQQLKQRFASGALFGFGGSFGGAPRDGAAPRDRGTPPAGATPRTGARGGGGPAGAGAFGNPIITAAAQTIGLDEQTLQSDIQAGQTAVQVAQAHGKSSTDLLAGLGTNLDPYFDRLIAASANGGGFRPRGTATPAS